MLELIKQVFIALLSIGWFLATKCVSLNNKPCMIRHFLVDLNCIELKYNPFMISLDKCSGGCISVDCLSAKIWVPSKTKDANVRVLNMIKNRNEAKTMVKHISCDCICKFNSTICNSNQKWSNETCQCEWTNLCTCKKRL